MFYHNYICVGEMCLAWYSMKRLNRQWTKDTELECNESIRLFIFGFEV